MFKKYDPGLASSLSTELGLQPAIGRVLAARAFSTADDVKNFLNPSLSGMLDPMLMSGMEAAVQRLVAAREKREKVCIYGDYDVDGVTATALMVSGLSILGLNAGYHIPNRMEDGYGLNEEALLEIGRQGYKVCVSVDCGVTAIAEALSCRMAGLDLIITDHHQPLEQLPDCTAVINPHRNDCQYPFKGLSGVGVAFSLLVALRARLKEKNSLDGNIPDLRELLDLVALGTVADMVPLNGQNRILVSAGLQRMGDSSRTGLSALKRVSGVSGQVSSGQVGFRLAPRLNAAGRLESAVPGVELLLTSDHSMAATLASELDAANTERQGVEKAIFEDASGMVEQSGGVDGRYSILLASPDWHPGVVGIVASRLVEKYHRPTILIAIDADGNGKGSGRSIPGFHLLDALHGCATLLARYGGHKAAAGVSVSSERIGEFASLFEKQAKAQLEGTELTPLISVDAEMLPEELSVALVEQIQKLAPFGMANPEPVFCIRGLRVAEKRVVGSHHLRLRLGGNGHYINAIAWRMAAREIPDMLDVLGTPEIDTWGGGARLQLSIRDIRPADVF